MLDGVQCGLRFQERKPSDRGGAVHPVLVARGDLQELFVFGIAEGGERLDTGDLHLVIVTRGAFEVHGSETVELVDRDRLDHGTFHVFVAFFKDQRGKLSAVAGEFCKEFVDDSAGVEGVVLDAQQILSDLVHVAHLAQSHRRVVGEVTLLGADVLLDLVAVFLRVQVGEPAAGVALVVDVALIEHLHIHRDRVDLRVDALDQRFLRRVVAAEGGAVVLSDRLYSHLIDRVLSVYFICQGGDLSVSAAVGRGVEHPFHMDIKPAPDVLGLSHMLILQFSQPIEKNVLYAYDQQTQQ